MFMLYIVAITKIIKVMMPIVSFYELLTPTVVIPWHTIQPFTERKAAEGLNTLRKFNW